MTIREEIKNRPEWEKEFDDLWEHWIYLSGVKQQVNFNAFRDGIKSVVGHILQSHLRESLERVRLGERDLGQIVRDTEGVYVPTAGEIEAEWGYNQAVSDSDKKIDTELKRLKGLGGKE